MNTNAQPQMQQSYNNQVQPEKTRSSKKMLAIIGIVAVVIAATIIAIVIFRGDNIVGRWYHIGYQDYGQFEEAWGDRIEFVEFFSNGHFVAGTIRDGDMRIDEEGTWSISGDRMFIRDNWNTDSFVFRRSGSRFYVYDGLNYAMVFSQSRPLRIPRATPQPVTPQPATPQPAAPAQEPLELDSIVDDSAVEYHDSEAYIEDIAVHPDATDDVEYEYLAPQAQEPEEPDIPSAWPPSNYINALFAYWDFIQRKPNLDNILIADLINFNWSDVPQLIIVEHNPDMHGEWHFYVMFYRNGMVESVFDAPMAGSQWVLFQEHLSGEMLIHTISGEGNEFHMIENGLVWDAHITLPDDSWIQVQLIEDDFRASNRFRNLHQLLEYIESRLFS